MSKNDSTIITGHDAIAYADEHGLTLSKYADPTEDARDGLTVDEAREVAKEDPSLVYVEVVPDAKSTAVIVRNGRPVAIVETSLRSGAVAYGFGLLTGGALHEVGRGKLSRAKRWLEDAELMESLPHGYCNLGGGGAL